jgi:hypothetical protein
MRVERVDVVLMIMVTVIVAIMMRIIGVAYVTDCYDHGYCEESLGNVCYSENGVGDIDVCDGYRHGDDHHYPSLRKL